MNKLEAAYLAGIIDGEGSITLTRIHRNENRRPCITISSSDKELLIYIQKIAGGNIIPKKNYLPERHKDSYSLNIRNKREVFKALKMIAPFLRIKQKRKRAEWILQFYNSVTPRNGKYTNQMLKKKLLFEEGFFKL